MKNVHGFVPVFLYAVTMLIFQIKRIISSEKWCNYVVTFFFFENAKNLGRSDDSKRRKKRGWPNRKRIEIMINNVVLLSSPVLHSLGLVIRTKNILKRITKYSCLSLKYPQAMTKDLWSRDLIQYNSSKTFENIVVIAA